MNIILFNGPPRSGKDTAAMAVLRAQLGHGKIFDRMSMPIKLAFADITNSNCDSFGNNERYEPIKEEFIPFLGCSYRQWQIDFSEKFMKPLYGQDIFGRLFIQRHAHQLLDKPKHNATFLVPDCGFQVEVDYLCKTLEHVRIFLLSIRRQGTDFTKDSRGWVEPHKKMASYETIANDDTQADFEDRVVHIVKEWVSA